MTNDAPLSTHDHDRGAAGLHYIYPVVSRRAGGLSIGINLNPNHACNWRCIYCQVPGLVRGPAPDIDLERLEAELRGFLREVLEGDFLERRLPPEARRLKDLAFSGDGESTTAREFDRVVERVGAVLRELDLAGRLPVVLITNGSQLHRPEVQRGVETLANLGGEVWFKLDRATQEGRLAVNDVRGGLERVALQLAACAERCPTRLQTCVFALDGEPPSEAEQRAYLTFVQQVLAAGTPLRGVLLYGLARPSQQAEAPRLERLPLSWLEGFARRIEALGLPVRVDE